ncbi:hypothetical protein [Streptomyces sp. NBC_01198]|uniref:hypothetical protein n=1 Tax=Streptomyces sp. NBC_01198 TaxID=2903769 RepID=UPI002E13B550|nr:hypothetical protein OG702_27365 [Streptomyces sp. NBC_01198]
MSEGLIGQGGDTSGENGPSERVVWRRREVYDPGTTPRVATRRRAGGERFAHSYGDRVRSDHRIFVDLFRNGRIPGL